MCSGLSLVKIVTSCEAGPSTDPESCYRSRAEVNYKGGEGIGLLYGCLSLTKLFKNANCYVFPPHYLPGKPSAFAFSLQLLVLCVVEHDWLTEGRDSF